LKSVWKKSERKWIGRRLQKRNRRQPASLKDFEAMEEMKKRLPGVNKKNRSQNRSKELFRGGSKGGV